MPIVGILYGVYYGLPLFLLDHYGFASYSKQTLASQDIEYALCLTIVGMGAMYAGYYFGPSLTERTAPHLRLNWDPNVALERFGVVLGLIGLFAFYLTGAHQLPPIAVQVADIVRDCSIIAIVLLFVMESVGKLHLWSRRFLWWFLVPARLLLGLATAWIYQSLEVALVLCLTLAVVRRRMPWMWFGIGVLALFILQPTKTMFRTVLASDSHLQSPVDKAITFVSIAEQAASGELMTYSQMLSATVNRTDDIMTLAQVVESSPSSVPFWGGYTYLPLLTKFVPRFLYPSKPLENLGGPFGHRYQMLAPSDEATAFNMPQCVEGYANFGAWGVVLEMLAIGLFYRLVELAFIHPDMGLGALVGGLYVFSKFLLIECNISLIVGQVFIAVVVIILLNVAITLVAKRQRPVRSSSARALNPGSPVGLYREHAKLS